MNKAFNKRLNANNWAIYAVKAWKESEKVTTKELNKDLKTFSYIGKSLKKFYKTNDINIRIILNQIIKLNNVFGIVESARMLFFYWEDPSYHSAIKTLLIYLNTLPKSIPEVDLFKIDLDERLIKILESI